MSLRVSCAWGKLQAIAAITEGTALQSVHLEDCLETARGMAQTVREPKPSGGGWAGRENESLDNDLSFDPAKCCF